MAKGKAVTPGISFWPDGNDLKTVATLREADRDGNNLILSVITPNRMDEITLPRCVIKELDKALAALDKACAEFNAGLVKAGVAEPDEEDINLD